MTQPETTLSGQPTHGPAAAAFLAAGIGAFTLALVSILNLFGVFAPPVLYAPVGGLTGKVAIAMLVWLVAWGLLHFRWNNRRVGFGKIFVATLILAGLGLLGTFPPLWEVLK
jgi:hypothetical protein